MTTDNNIRLIVIDSFCGAGGVTEGYHRAVDMNGNKVCKVIIGINHDDVAIQSHAANHPDTVHFIEDFTTLDPNRLTAIVEAAKLRYPCAKVLFWASAECTHHSKAKGGLPRDADSRSLPEHIERYVQVLNPDIIGVENVVEFIDWGPLSESGKPIKELKGIYYNQWRDALIAHGYKYDYRKLNAADFGAYTSRIRYFGIFSKDEDNIAFPVQTHTRKGDMFTEKWKSVKDVLELDIEGDSIFNRKKPLVDATIERILNGIVRFVIGGDKDFLLKYNSMNQQRKYKSPSMYEPCPTISCQDRIAIVKTKMISAYYGNGYNSSMDEPAGTITTKDRFALVTAKQKQFYLMNPQFKNNGGSIDKPCFTLIARMDKMPPYLVETNAGSEQIKINPHDTDTMVKLKNICNDYGIIDIKMRMLLIDELLRIQGFGDTYKLKGTKAEMKKFIGNAVECNQAKVLAESIANTIHTLNIMSAI